MSSLEATNESLVKTNAKLIEASESLIKSNNKLMSANAALLRLRKQRTFVWHVSLFGWAATAVMYIYHMLSWHRG